MCSYIGAITIEFKDGILEIPNCSCEIENNTIYIKEIYKAKDSDILFTVTIDEENGAIMKF